jgi:hypothetical protein
MCRRICDCGRHRDRGAWHGTGKAVRNRRASRSQGSVYLLPTAPTAKEHILDRPLSCADHRHLCAFVSVFLDPFSGKTFPGLPIEVSSPDHVGRLETYAQVDSGAELSLFDGRLVQRLGIDLMAGPEILLASSGGFSITGRIHQIELSHLDLGRFTLDAAISTVPIRRNLLGRDFFQHIQIGFREFHHTLLITAAA